MIRKYLLNVIYVTIMQAFEELKEVCLSLYHFNSDPTLSYFNTILQFIFLKSIICFYNNVGSMKL